eukprot:2498237-Amphidinium_carterae.1
MAFLGGGRGLPHFHNGFGSHCSHVFVPEKGVAACIYSFCWSGGPYRLPRTVLLGFDHLSAMCAGAPAWASSST